MLYLYCFDPVPGCGDGQPLLGSVGHHQTAEAEGTADTLKQRTTTGCVHVATTAHASTHCWYKQGANLYYSNCRVPGQFHPLVGCQLPALAATIEGNDAYVHQTTPTNERTLRLLQRPPRAGMPAYNQN